MATLSKKNFSNPDEKMTPEKTDMRIVDLAGTKMARIEVQPGWKWSECIKPIKKTESCEAKHIGIVQSGRMKLKHKDGSELEVGPGDAYIFEPGHDAWVLGDEAFIGFDLTQLAQELNNNNKSGVSSSETASIKKDKFLS